MKRHTKIVCTIGPASANPGTLRAMIRAGMDVARLNTSHGAIDDHIRMVELVRQAAKDEGQVVGILMDLGGPKIRTGKVEGGPVVLEGGQAIRLTSKPVPVTRDLISVAYPELAADVRPGDHILLDDGHLELQATGISGEEVDCRVIQGGLLTSSKGVNFPHSNLSTNPVTPHDREAILAGASCGVDFFALSFVRHGDDIVHARSIVAGAGADTPIIAKIERRQAVANLEGILSEADGVMVARGDLGVELSPEEVPVLQRSIIRASARHMIPVITATQMLESMVDSPRPTRAEASDVANAVWDYSDAVMLSQETAVGRFPVETVAMMERIIRTAEGAGNSGDPPDFVAAIDDHAQVIALAARRIVESDQNIRAVVCFTRSGYTSFLASKLRLNIPIISITPSESIARRLALARSVIPRSTQTSKSLEEIFASVDAVLLNAGDALYGDEVVVLAGFPVTSAGTTNFLKLHRVGEGSSS
ncbi:MAG TPA: pyruvate kinase [Tepidiformaceae bacterium]|nr:pyruvate kinase [Tepidiformaceae bacterium]